jgi:hypothetical protein
MLEQRNLEEFICEFNSKIYGEREKTIKEKLVEIPDLLKIITIFYSLYETPLKVERDNLTLSANYKIGMRRNTEEEIISNFVKYFKNMPS